MRNELRDFCINAPLRGRICYPTEEGISASVVWPARKASSTATCSSLIGHGVYITSSHANNDHSDRN